MPQGYSPTPSTDHRDTEIRLLREALREKQDAERRRIMAARNRAKRWVQRNALPLKAVDKDRTRGIPLRTVRAVLFALADFLAEDGAATVTYVEVADRAGYGRRTAIRVLLACERNGYIHVERAEPLGNGRQPPSRYSFRALMKNGTDFAPE